MGVESVGNDYSLPSSIRVAKKELDRGDFLDLLVKQLQNQNPLEPQSNEEFISTMAQFNSVESLAALDKNTQYNQAMSMIGKLATVIQINKDPVEGIVQRAGLVDDKVFVVIDGNSYSIGDVKAISSLESSLAPVSDQGLLQAAGLIGKEVRITDGSQEITGTVEKVGLENGSLKVYVDGLAYDLAGITEIR